MYNSGVVREAGQVSVQVKDQRIERSVGYGIEKSEFGV